MRNNNIFNTYVYIHKQIHKFNTQIYTFLLLTLIASSISNEIIEMVMIPGVPLTPFTKENKKDFKNKSLIKHLSILFKTENKIEWLIWRFEHLKKIVRIRTTITIKKDQLNSKNNITFVNSNKELLMGIYLLTKHRSQWSTKPVTTYNNEKPYKKTLYLWETKIIYHYKCSIIETPENLIFEINSVLYSSVYSKERQRNIRLVTEKYIPLFLEETKNTIQIYFELLFEHLNNISFFKLLNAIKTFNKNFLTELFDKRFESKRSLFDKPKIQLLTQLDYSDIHNPHET